MRCRFLAPIGLIFLSSASSFSQVSWLTRSFDNARSGANLRETILNTANVRPATFGKLFERQVDGQIYGQPLYMANVSIPNKGVRNLVFVATMNDSVYAFDADDPNANAPIWHTSFLSPGVTPVPYSEVTDAKDAYPVIGIVSTPVIKPNGTGGGTIYVTAKTEQVTGSTTSYSYNLHALDLTTGAEKAGSPVLIQPSVPSTAPDSVNGVLTFNAKKHMQRPGLLLLNNVVYAAFASHGDRPPYHGWIVGYDTDTLQQVAVYCATPNTGYGGIWQSGQGLSVDAKGYIYAITGNAVFEPTSQSYGDSFLKLSQANGLTLADSFTPYNESTLNSSDLDLGCSGPIMVPGQNLLVGAGKQGEVYVLNLDSLGGHQTSNDSQIVQSWLATKGHVHGSAVFWNSPGGLMMYIWSEFDRLKAYLFSGGQFDTTPAYQSAMTAPNGMPGGFLTVSANGSTAGTGIVWATIPLAGDANQSTVPGVLRAFDASNLTEIWNSRMVPLRDDLGWHAKFNPPIVVNGKVYVAAFGSDDGNDPHKLVCYGLLPPPTSPPDAASGLTAAAGSGQISLSWTAPNTASSYRVLRGTSPGGPYSAIKTGMTTTSLIDSGLTNGATYYYVVAADNSAGEAPLSNEAAATPGSLTAVYRVNAGGGAHAPFATDAYFSGAKTHVATTAVDTSGVMDPAPMSVYQSERYGKFTYTFGSLAPGATYLVRLHFAETIWYLPGQRLIDVSANGTPMLTGFDVLAETGETYRSCVKEFAVAANSSGQIVLSFGPNVNSPDQNGKVNGIEILAASTTISGATNLLASPGNGSVSLKWNLSPGATSYDLYRGTAHGAEQLYASDLTGPTFTDTQVQNGTTYYYILTAVGQGGEGPASDEAIATPDSDSGFEISVAPSTVSSMPGNATSASVGVQAAKGFSGDVTLEIDGMPAGVTCAFAPSTVSGSGSTTLTLDVGPDVTPGTYPLTVEGISGSVTETAPLTLQVTSSVLPPPSTVSAGAGNTQVFLNWSAVAGASSYNVLRSTHSTGPYAVIGNSTNNFFTDKGLTNGTRYYYAITTLSAAGESGMSTIVTAMPRSQLTLSLSADAYIQAGSASNKNFGTATTLLVKRASNSSTNGLNRCTYLKLDLANVTSAPSSAVLTFHVDSSATPKSASPTLNVYQIPSTSWSESTLTWSIAPGLDPSTFSSTGTLVWSGPVSLGGSYVSLDLTSVLSANLGQVITLQILDPNIDGVLSAFSSRESATPPVLKVKWPTP